MPKTKRKIKPSKRPKKRRMPKKEQAKRSPLPSDIEDLLVEMVINSKEKAINGTDVENLIYSTTSGLGLLGYGFGFSVGRAVTLKLGTNAPLTSVLDRIGLHNSLYYPLRDKVIISSRPHQRHLKPNINKSIHVYESGFISGYLSTSTGTQITTEEKRCVYNGARECQFVATPLLPKPSFSNSGVEQVASSIAIALCNGRYTKLSNEYYRILAYLPLMDSTISDQMLRLMMISGERLGTMHGKGQFHELVTNISNYFGVKHAKMEKKGRKTIIKLRYESYNSIQAFVAIPAAVIVGFAKTTGRTALAHFAINKDGTYTARIEIEKKRN